MDDPETEARQDGPVWLVRVALILLFLAFAAFLARETATVIQRLS